MAAPYSNNCELPSEKYYHELDIVAKTSTYESLCDSNGNIISGENPFVKSPDLKDFCYKLVSNLELLKAKEKVKNFDIRERCIYLKHWLHDHAINAVDIKSPISYIMFLHSVWLNIIDSTEVSIDDACKIEFFPVSIRYLEKWKRMHDYNQNYEDLKSLLNSKAHCKQKYCKDLADITNIYKEFMHVCSTDTNNRKCPDFFNKFKETYEKEASEIETQCKGIYDELGLYKVKVYFGEQGIEEYIEQYESEYTFSFFEKLIGYSIKYYLSKTIHYSKYIVLPIILILLFYFFMKKLSFFGSKISPRVDGMRKMWINVQGVTNPATLLNPMKPPGGGNKIGLPYMPK
ncbi:PIR Superfamily Protein [Plasmodium ovale curtisi]|uniref:PIR Superfamily Protein n=1 Tax=Plasmodium ovale curtisi TaxID=864141 RepID=A0A1A8X9A8_PLAOA|nr:PIR Superfamily Protein [Plasmodium ovale curtisi]